MRRMIPAALAALMLLSLCACGHAPAQGSEPYAPAAETASVPPAETPAPAPKLSPGAAERVYRAVRFEEGPDGRLYTSLTRADGLVCLYDLLPEGVGYIARFLMTDDGIYAAVKSEYFTPEPAELFFFPAEGEPVHLADNLTSDGMFVMTDDALFWTDADDGALRRLPLNGGGPESVLTDEVRLLDADGGFIYYAKGDGVYRNDSTLGAEALLFSPASLSVRADSGRLYSLSYDSGGTAHIELREPDGSPAADVPLEEETDNFLVSGGRLYIPQPAAGKILVLDAEGGDPAAELALPDGTPYCLLWYADGDAAWYETVQDGEIVLCRSDGEHTENLGPELLF